VKTTARTHSRATSSQRYSGPEPRPIPLITKRQLGLLKPYLEGDEPTHINVDRDTGEETQEWNMHCPLHEDVKRSASINIDKGVWYCFSCDGSGQVAKLVTERANWVAPEISRGGSGNGRVHVTRSTKPTEDLSEVKVQSWHSTLMSSEAELDFIVTERGIMTDTVKRFELGWDKSRGVFTIPVRGLNNELLNVRRYNPYPPPEMRKIWGVSGHNKPVLYPLSVLKEDPEFIVIGEGEWDVLLTIQNGFPAITRTAGADVWRGEWSELFADKTIYLGHDADAKGQIGNRRVARALAKVADIRILRLPYKIVKKHGKDLTDFWKEHDRADFEELLRDAEPWQSDNGRKSISLTSVLESFDSKHVGDPVRLQVTIKGKKEPGYTIPYKAHLTCTQDAGAACNVCPLRATGDDTVEIKPDNPVILAMLDKPERNVADLLRQEYGAMKCNRLTIEIQEYQPVEILIARPSLDTTDGTGTDQYRNLKVTNVGHYDTLPNNTVQMIGALQINPNTQNNEFQAWELEKTETSVDHFEITPELVRLMERFRPEPGQRPIQKLVEINKNLSAHVTQISERTEMHCVMDLTFHSTLSFKFNGKVIHKGWLESLILGDTRTGKSETATALIRHYGAGEVVSGESASYAGIIGGLQQMSGRDWMVTWGLVPLNDRRLVVIDEVSGLSTDDISKMSDVRASGIARLIKIQQEVTYARTRMIWLSNPRNAKMADYTYGVQAIFPLIGNNEDVARFDLVMALAIDEINAENINSMRSVSDLRYTSEACHALLMWVWTRSVDQIVWEPGAEEAVLKYAISLSRDYTEDPPLIQAADVRIKIARVAAALAGRTFSTDPTHEKLVITKQHVRDAVLFIRRIYEMRVFGYAEHSKELITARKRAEILYPEMEQYLRDNIELAIFLKSSSTFVRQDLEEILNASRETANSIINNLWSMKMIRKEKHEVHIEPTLHRLLREHRWE